MKKKTTKILAIDEVQNNLIDLKKIIHESFKNVKVFTALKGSDGIEIARLENPDVILINIIKPNLDGFEVCEQLKSDEYLSVIPIVLILDVKNKNTTAVKALELGVEAFLTNPIHESELVAQIKAIIKRKNTNFGNINKEKELVELLAQKTKELAELNNTLLNLKNDFQRDKDARKKSELFLNESDSLYSTAFKTSPYAITVTNIEDGLFVNINDAFLKITGYSYDEVIGNTVCNLGIWNKCEERNIIISTLLKNGLVENKETHFNRKDGSKVNCLFSAQIIQSNGKSYILANINDISVQNTAKQELINSKQQFLDLVTKIPVGVYSMRSKPNGNFNFEYVSPKMEQITNISAESILNNANTAFQYFHPDDLPYLLKANTDGIIEKKTVKAVGRLIVKGEIKWIEISSIPEIQPNGDILWHGLMADITQQKLSEITIQTNEQKFKAIVDTSPDDITIADLTGKIMFVSKAALSIFGLNSVEDALGKMITDFLAPQDLEKAFENIEKLFKGEVVNPGEYVAIKADGSEFYIEVNAEFIRNDKNEPTNILLIIRDITKRIIAENELKLTSKKLEGLMNAIPDLLFEVGADGTIYKYHTQSTDLLADKPENFLGKKFFDIIPADAAQVCSMALEEAKTKGISKGKQYSLLLPHGKFWFDVSVAPIKNNIDNELRFVFLARDITEQKKSVFELVKLNRIQAFNGQINDLIVRIRNKKQLFEEVCKVSTTYGNFRMSWISEIDEQTNLITPLVWDGFEDGYLQIIQNIWKNNKLTEKPTYNAFNNSKVSICNNIANDLVNEPWKQEALKRGYLSSIALPIIVREKVIGTFNLYASEVDFFTLNEEVELLENITKNIAFSLEKIVDEEDRLIAEQKVNEKDNEFRKLSANVPDLIFQFTRRPDGSYYVPIASEGIINIFGCKPADVINDFTPIASVIFPDDIAKVIDCIEYSAANLTYFTCEFRVQIPGKPIQWIYSKSNPEKLADGSVTWYGFNTDITERKQAEEQIKQSESFLKETQMIANLGTYVLNITENNWQSSEILNSILGIEPEYEKTFESWLYVVHPEWRIPMFEYFKLEVLEQKTIFDKEYKIIRQNNQAERWVHGVGKLEFDGNNNPIKMIGTIHDITERKHTEALIAENNLRLELAMKSAKMAWWEFEIETGNIIFEKSKAEMLGYSASDFNHIEDFAKLLHPGDYEIAMQVLKNHLEGTINKYEVEYRILTKLGTYIWLQDFGLITKRDENNKPLLISGIVININDKKCAEEYAEQNLSTISKLSLAINQSPVTTVITDVDGKIIFVNPKFTEVTGYTPDEIIGKNPNVLNSGYTSKTEYKELWKTILEGNSWTGIFQNKKKNGELFWENAVISPVKNKYGVITNFLAVKEDITEKRFAELALIESNNRYNLVAKATNDAIWDLDILTGKIIRTGDGFRNIFGHDLDSKDYNEHNWKNFIHPDDLIAVENSQQAAFLNPEEYYWQQDYRFLKANGDYAYVHDKGYIIRDNNQNAIRMIGAAQDITERVKHLSAIEEQNSKLREIAWLQSHVVRAPLSRMMGIVYLLKELELNGEEFKTWVQHFVNSSAELDQVIHDISSKTDVIDLSLK